MCSATHHSDSSLKQGGESSAALKPSLRTRLLSSSCTITLVPASDVVNPHFSSNYRFALGAIIIVPTIDFDTPQTTEAAKFTKLNDAWHLRKHKIKCFLMPEHLERSFPLLYFGTLDTWHWCSLSSHLTSTPLVQPSTTSSLPNPQEKDCKENKKKKRS